MAHPHILAMAIILASLLPNLAMSAEPSVPLLGSNNTDLAALQAFRSQLSDPSCVLASNWTSEVSFCRWAGVSCSRRRQRVTALELPGMPLQGELSPYLGNLSFLRVLNLTGTELVGSVPDDVGRLSRLKVLDLSHNSFSGTITSTISNITRLQALELGSNQLHGQIPDELLNLYNLRYLSLKGNDLSGMIPNFSSTATPSLSHMYFQNNTLSGHIPHGIATLSMLQVLFLKRNQLTGPAPPSIFNMSRLELMSLGQNNLHGTIPGNKSFKLPMLQTIDFYKNKFTGPIPSGLAACKHLQILNIPGNLFVDVVPTWLGQLSQLTGISIGGNHFVGPIPGVLSNLTMLETLDISFSNLSGQIPVELETMRKLTRISLHDNLLTGPFPAFIGNLSELTILDISYNYMTGPVPSTLGNSRSLRKFNIDFNYFVGGLDFLASLGSCRQLQYIRISYNPFTSAILNTNHVGNLSTNLLEFEANANKITGRLPATLSNLSSLYFIALQDNQLSNAIPESLTTLENLKVLALSGNIMSGPVPTKIGMLRGLVQLFFDNNKFSGSIPDGIANLTMLQEIDLSYNKLSSITSLFHLNSIVLLNVSNNFLSGALPSNLGSMKAVDTIDLSNNQFVGSLPNSFANNQMLTYFNISHNSIEDSIPDSFRKLGNLAVLDLSSNNISGTIPNYLANFTYLAILNLSFNNLEGRVPVGGVFANITLQSLMGNARLCGGPPSLGFSACPDKSESTHDRNFLKFLLPVAATGFSAFIVFLLLIKHKKHKKKGTDVSAHTDIADMATYRSVSYHEVVRATDNFCQNYLLGVGSFGKVYKGQLDDGVFVAIKVFNMQFMQAVRSFDAECKALRMARHRNLIKILTACSNLDFKALLLQYMPNGSLEEYLHNESRSYIGFLRRLDTMLDVSMAMEYLHHDHDEVVLHCDLKPSNVLFDEEMTAHVADFGVAKLLLGDDCSMVTASMPGTVGYMAPEYAFMGKASRKSDVFSFGIMLLEAFTGKRPTDPMFVGGLSLRKWVSEAFPARLIDVTDKKLLHDEDTRLSFVHMTNTSPEPSSPSKSANFLEFLFELGLMCSSEPPEQRLAMNDVVAKLKEIKKSYSVSVQMLERPG